MRCAVPQYASTRTEVFLLSLLYLGAENRWCWLRCRAARLYQFKHALCQVPRIPQFWENPLPAELMREKAGIALHGVKGDFSVLYRASIQCRL